MPLGPAGYDSCSDAPLVFGGPCEIGVMRAWASTESVLSLPPEAVRLRLAIYRRVMRAHHAGEIGSQRTANGRFGLYHVAARLSTVYYSSHNRTYIVAATNTGHVHNVAAKWFTAYLSDAFEPGKLPLFTTAVTILEEPTV